MVFPPTRSTLRTETDQADTRFGFTWLVVDGNYLIRSPDDRFKEVPEVVVETLRERAVDTSVDELVAGTERRNPDAADVIREMVDRGFIREGAPVERIRPPADVALRPRAAGVGLLLLLVGGLFVGVLSTVAGPLLDHPLRYLLDDALVTVPPILGAVVVHEYGHYRAARAQGLDPSFGVSVANGIVPTVVTRTPGGWALPRNRRMWITLAGPAAGLAWTAGVFGLYHLTGAPGLALAGVACFNLQVVPLLPVFHGDGYNLLADLLGERNLRPRGLADLGAGNLTWAAAYVVVSYGFAAVQVGVGLVVGYLAGDLLGVVVMLGLAVAVHARSRIGLPEAVQRDSRRFP